MDFSEAVKSAFSKYTQFSGRSFRSEYWYFFLFISIGQLVSLIIDAQTGSPFTEGYGPVFMIFSLAMLIPHIAVCARRFHDIDMSGVWMLILFVPFIGTILGLYWMCKKGDEGKNRFGPDPLVPEKDDVPANIETSSVETDNDAAGL